MLRRVFMWLAVICLLGMALSSGVVLGLQWSGWPTGWTFYSPYASTPSPIAMQVIEQSHRAQMFLLPLAAVFSAIYIVLVERRLSEPRQPRGFAVEAAGTIGNSSEPVP